MQTVERQILFQPVVAIIQNCAEIGILIAAFCCCLAPGVQSQDVFRVTACGPGLSDIVDGKDGTHDHANVVRVARVMVLWAGTNDLPTFKVPDLLQSIEDNFSSIFDLGGPV